MSSSAHPRPRRPLRLSLRAKLYLGFLSFAFAGLMVGGALVERNVRAATRADVEDRLSYETTMLGQMTASSLFGEIDPTDTSLHASVKALGNAVHTQLAILAKTGELVADSGSDDPRGSPSQADEPEIVAALKTGTGMSARDGRIFVARAIMSDAKLLGFARSSVSIDVVEAHVRDVRRRLVFGAALAALIAIVLSYAISSRILRPMGALFVGAKRFGAGDLLHPIAVTSKDEIAELSATFNEMTGSLRETIAKLDARNRDVRLVLDNVSQGLLTLDRGGVMSAERSAILDTWFGPAKEATVFWDYLSLTDPRAAGMFQCAWEELLDGVMPFAVAFDQLPSRVATKDRTYELQYTPLRDPSGDEGMRGMLVVVSDVTARMAAERAEGEQREIASAFERMARDRAGFVEFFAEAEALVVELSADLRPPLPTVRRKLHTLKGNASTFGLARLGSLCHRLEDRIAASECDLSAPDRAELAGAWDQLAQRLKTLLGDQADRALDVDPYDCEELLRALVDGQPRQDIARRVAEWKLERVDTRLTRFASQSRDLAARLGKANVDVHVAADRVRVSRDALARFWTTFIHVVRNALDHGLEDAGERAKHGKRPTARLSLAAARRDDVLVIEVTDDGRGVDWEGVARTAKGLGLPHGDRPSLVDALFRDGLSTKPDVSEESGRGIGLGAARHECEVLGGTASVISEPGAGTTIRFTFPMERIVGSDVVAADVSAAPAVPVGNRLVRVSGVNIRSG